MDSEFKRFLDTLKILGIKYSLNHGDRDAKENWQDIILKAGYNLTALACTAVVVGDIEYIFSNGQAHWKTTSVRELGYGPRGLFLLSRNRKTKEVQNRVAYNFMTNALLKGEGLEAAKITYPDEFSEPTRY